METIFRISGYYKLNGEKSDFIEMEKTLHTRQQLDELRNKLKAETGHDIALVHTEMPANAPAINH